MKIEYIASGDIDTPLIRLYDFGRDGAFTLHLAVNDLASGVRDQVELQELPGVESLGGCRLGLHAGSQDLGVVKQGTHFTWTLTRAAWRDVGSLITPFCERAAPGMFQHLDLVGEIAVVFSVDGSW